jgi:hypothetical protein
MHLPSRQHKGPNVKLVSRLDVFQSAGFLALSTILIQPLQVNAATEEKTVYLSGKPPKVPGAKPKDKSDFSGTRKDPAFLRSLSQCKSECESTGKAKDDCLSECQDICCTTYEQVRYTHQK